MHSDGGVTNRRTPIPIDLEMFVKLSGEWKSKKISQVGILCGEWSCRQIHSIAVCVSMKSETVLLCEIGFECTNRLMLFDCFKNQMICFQLKLFSSSTNQMHSTHRLRINQ